MDVVQTAGLTKQFRPSRSVLVQALRGVDLSIAQGEFVAIMGPSGCGKTTLLHLLGGLDRPSSGQVLIDGVDLAMLSDAERTELRRQKVGFVFQKFNLFPTLKAGANLRLAAQIKGVPRNDPSLGKLLSLVDLEHKANAVPGELSIGQQQRVAVARALVGDPRLLLADEPTGNLDSESSAKVLALFREVNERLDQTLVMITHSEEAASHADRIVRMRDGQVVEP